MSKLIAFLSCSLIAASLSAQATPASSSDEVLRALLQEIRSLRLTMQKMNGYQLRGQLLLERLRVQQSTVRELAQQVETQNMEKDYRMMGPDGFENILEEAVERLRAETNPDNKKRIEREIDMMKRRQEIEAKRRDQLISRNERNEARLIEEQNKLRAIEEELVRLEAEITRLEK